MEQTCGAPGCTNLLKPMGRGRPSRYCSTACRVRAHRLRKAHRGPVIVEVDHGSTSAKGRTGGRVWLVALRRGEDRVIVAVGLSRMVADDLAERLRSLLAP